MMETPLEPMFTYADSLGQDNGVEAVHDRLVKFWTALSDNHKKGLSQVSEDLPLAVRDLGGLLSPYQGLMSGNWPWKVLCSLAMVLKVILNVCTAALPVYQLFHHEGVSAHHSHSYVKLSNSTMTVCYDSLGNSAESEATCVTHHRPDALLMQRAVACIELAVISWAALSFLFFTMIFLLKGKNARARFLLQFPFVFVFVPRIAGGFSLLQGLVFANVSYAARLFWRGDMAMFTSLVFSSSCPGLKRRFFDLYSRTRGMIILELAISAVCVLFGLVALLEKFTFMYFVSTVSIRNWDLRSVVLYLGFVNQMASIFDMDLNDLSRVLLMKFGGKNATWSEPEMQVVSEYFGLIFSRFAIGRISKQRWSGLQMMTAFLTFNSDRLQHLLLSNRRQQAIEEVRKDRFHIIEQLLRPDLVGADKEYRVQALQGTMEEWQRHLLAENERCLCKVEEGRRGADSHFMKLAEKTRLLALIQSHMADLYAENIDEPGTDDELENDEDDWSSSASGSPMHASPSPQRRPYEKRPTLLTCRGIDDLTLPMKLV
mmetsp:Transcript_11340/g.28203  ORF Transcript_11340/g.28203 Transcript_11340/m.28203 type:complete len:543 (-) Transcript_11340:122-1750(-)